jgi:hypothetical protein
MRVSAFLTALAMIAVAAPARAEPILTAEQQAKFDRMMKECRPTSPYVAQKRGVFKDQRLEPRKLTELPPADTYMAVFRHVGGCEAPLTMTEYRNPRRR